MTKPGEYTVLVTLKAPDEKQRMLDSQDRPLPPLADRDGPLWVAKPITVRVPATSK
jgi:hypothetical protein